ncbi:MAG TPA: NUDIX domain-containing protein [Candidatus Dormibacteraeota bacterium]
MPAASRRFDERSAGGLVVRTAPSGREVLLIRVGSGWSLPKGNLDAGETPEQTALREISEETGLPLDSLRILAELPPSEYAYRRRDNGRLVFKRVDHYLVELTADAPLRPQAEEVDEVAWVPLAGAERRVSYRDLRAAVVAAQRLLGDDSGPGT